MSTSDEEDEDLTSSEEEDSEDSEDEEKEKKKDEVSAIDRLTAKMDYMFEKNVEGQG